MKRTSKLALALVIMSCVLIFFLVPVQGEVSYGGCVNCSQHYARSLSCQVVFIGVYYFDNKLSFGCDGPDYF